ncbi:helix-turn-helix domain-containing protein [Synechococcus elongatus]|uniref:Helix-turn-helix domain-containing protein n=1 Tax=Synechococcus elongatus PCC 11802 TaxID=2283154 RepID=A0AAT9JXJ3_SYNEL|nr:helix-turn-helix domain-containing protein [Synechococcus elongatus]QFZ93053.1 helix-turn-helix domain-containing protein [Synechococcus elongatus PCC 11802]
MTESLVYTEELYRIGAELRAAREAQGLDLAAVAAQCRVRASYLEAIESGEVQRLPEPVFVQGFIRTYARSLGLDPDTLLADLSLAEVKTPTPATPKSSVSDQRSPVKIALPSKASLGLVGLIVVVVAAVAGTGLAVWNWRQQVALAPTPTAPEPPPPPAAALPNTPLEPAPAPNTVAIAFRGPAWAEISVDGKVVFSGTGRAGQQLSFSPKQEVAINPGRPDLIWLSRAGQEAQPLGTISEVQIYRIPVQAEPSTATSTNPDR